MGVEAAGVIYLAVSAIASMMVPTKTLADSSGPLLEVVPLGPLSMDTRIFVSVAVMFTKEGEVFLRAGLLLALGVGFWLLNLVALRGRREFDTGVLEAVLKPAPLTGVARTNEP